MVDTEKDQIIINIEDHFDLENVKSTIAKDNLFNAVYELNNTLLHYAVEFENEEIVKYIVLDSRSNIDVCNDEGLTPLTLALGQHFIYNKTIVDILVKAGADIYSTDNPDKSALRIIGKSEWTSEEILQLFFQKVENECSSDKEEIVKRLIDFGWPLHKIVLLKDVELTRIALQRGYADVIDAVDSAGNTVLHTSVKNVDIEHVKLLLEHNANVNILDPRQRTPLSFLYDSNAENLDEKLEILSMLLEHEATLTFNFSNNDRSVFDIFRYANAEAIELLLQKTYIDLHMTDSCGNTPVHALATNQNPGVIQQLSGREVNLNLHNKNGITPLMSAVIECVIGAVDYLTLQDVDTEATDKDGRTALYIAVEKSRWREKEYRECIQLLLERGANAQVQIYEQGPTIVHVFLEHYISVFMDPESAQNCFLLGQIVLDHLAWEEACGVSIIEPIYESIYAERRFQQYFELNKNLLFTEIHRSIKLIDLMGSDETIEDYIDQEFMPYFKYFMSERCSSYYFSSILQKRLWRPIYIVALKNEAARFVCKIMRVDYDSCSRAIDSIVEYFEPHDIEKFLDTKFRKSHYVGFDYVNVQNYWNL